MEVGFCFRGLGHRLSIGHKLASSEQLRRVNVLAVMADIKLVKFLLGFRVKMQAFLHCLHVVLVLESGQVHTILIHVSKAGVLNKGENTL